MCKMFLNENRVGLALYRDLQRLNVPAYEDSTLISDLVKQALKEGGLGLKNPKAPLVDIIEPGMTVLLKPNWMMHHDKNSKGINCIVTHPLFVEAVLREVLKANPGRILIGDAPVQKCIFERVVSKNWINRINTIAHPYQVAIIDFRRRVRNDSKWKVKISQQLRDPGSFILFNLGSKSLLEAISWPTGRFRITDYKPSVLANTHRLGCHQYFLSREIFEANVIINLPKLKTHRRAGLTAALKNLVGISSDKDYLPHYRLGGSAQGGDCYKGNMHLKRLSEYFLDNSNRRINKPDFFVWRKAAGLLLKLNKMIFSENEFAGGWYGNDTLWRTILDLNRIAIYGRKDGSLSTTPLRRVYSITDAIIASEGNGPLAANPIKLGAVTFAYSSAFADLLHAALMRFDWRKIPLVQNAFKDFSFPLTLHKPADIKVYAKGRTMSLDEVVEKYGLCFEPSDGWKGHIEIDRPHTA